MYRTRLNCIGGIQMKWLLLFILGPPILTLILRILIFIVRYGPGFVGAIFDLICCVLGLTCIKNKLDPILAEKL